MMQGQRNIKFINIITKIDWEYFYVTSESKTELSV